MKKDKCPNCKKKKLEKIPPAFNIIDNREWWGCLNCGLTFFQKTLDKLVEMWYNKNFGPGACARTDEKEGYLPS